MAMMWRLVRSESNPSRVIWRLISQGIPSGLQYKGTWVVMCTCTTFIQAIELYFCVWGRCTPKASVKTIRFCDLRFFSFFSSNSLPQSAHFFSFTIHSSLLYTLVFPSACFTSLLTSLHNPTQAFAIRHKKDRQQNCILHHPLLSNPSTHASILSHTYQSHPPPSVHPPSSPTAPWAGSHTGSGSVCRWSRRAPRRSRRTCPMCTPRRNKLYCVRRPR